MKKMIHILYDLVVDNLVRIVGIVMTISILCQIGTRLLLKVPFSWTDELARFSFIWFCFLGSVMTLRHNMHLGIDYFESKMSPKVKFYNRIFVYALVIVFGAFVAFFGTMLLEIVSIQKSPVMRIPMVYVYMALPISGLLYAILGVDMLYHHIKEGKSSAA